MVKRYIVSPDSSVPDIQVQPAHRVHDTILFCWTYCMPGNLHTATAALCFQSDHALCMQAIKKKVDLGKQI